MNDSSHPRYSDGQPIRNGDAVLVQGVHGGRVEMSIPGARPTVVVEMAREKRRVKLYQGPDTERLVLVERDSADFKRATFEWLSRHAEAGVARAQFGLALAHWRGAGTPKDVDRGIEWIRKAAAQGDADAQAELGFMYSWGRNLRRDFDQAMHWYGKAAEQGQPRAQFGLGEHYEQGQGVPVDYVQAVRWYRAAAEQGYAPAMCNLADKYEHGKGVEQDFTRAFELYSKAADSDIGAAMEALSGLYRDGRGVERNLDQARKWALEAVRRGYSPKDFPGVLEPGKLPYLMAEQREALPRHYCLWLDRTQRTNPIEPGKIVPAIAELYRAAGLATPRVVIVPSPIVMIFAGSFASYILRSRISLPEVSGLAGHERDTVRAIAMAMGNAGSAGGADEAPVNVFEATLEATYHPADVAAANAMDRAVIREIQQGFDGGALAAMDEALRDALRDPFGGPRFTERLASEVDAWGAPLARAIFGAGGEAELAVQTVREWWRHVRDGNANVYGDCCLTAARDVLGLELPEFDAYEAWENCAIHGSFRFMHAKFCIVCDFPAEIGKTGYRWRDGWSV